MRLLSDEIGFDLVDSLHPARYRGNADLIIGSWCGKKFRPERVVARAGFGQIPAVRHLHLYEIKSSSILQPGPAALTDGLVELQRIIERWATRC